MFEKMFDFNGMFGKVAPGMCRLSANGAIAVKTSNGYKTYNIAKGKLVNSTAFCLDVGDEMFFVLPTNKVKVGDIILVNKTPRCVLETNGKTITVVNYENNTIEQLLPERHVFMGNTYFYGRITSPFCGMFGMGSNGMKNMLQLMMFSKMFGGNAAGEGGMNPMMAMMLMNGGNNVFSNMFNGMFDGDGMGLADIPGDVEDEDGEEGEDNGKEVK